jgi:Uma2 family endonuclease
MASVTESPRVRGNGYPTTDGKPMAETDRHRDLMFDLIKVLQRFYALAPDVYVSGNLLLFYERGNKRRHVSPDVFVAKKVPKRERDNYLVWEEGKGPDLVIELTSSSTRHVDVDRKFRLYRDVLKVKEYFLFDPHGDYLHPRLQGYRLRGGEYVPIRPVQGRLPSKVVGLHLEARDRDLRLYDPATGQWLPTPEELAARTTEAEARAAEADAAARRAEEAQRQAEAEALRLRQELEALRNRRDGES